MAKNAKKINALGLNLTPDTFTEVTRAEETKEHVVVSEAPVVIPEEPVAQQEEPKVEAPKAEEVKAEDPAKEKKPAKKKEEKEPSGLLSKLASSKSEKKVNTSFTLSPSNIERLQKVAKQKNYTMSALLDEILTELFNEAGL